MSIVNHKGGFNTTMRITQNSSNESICMLDKPFLKKAENWSLQVTDLFINKSQPLNLELTEQLRIVPFRGVGFGNGWLESDYVFVPKKCYTVLEYVIQLQEFFKHFSFIFWQYGIQGVVGITQVQANHLITQNFNTRTINYVKNNVVPNTYPTAAETLNGIVNIDEGYASKPIICSCFVDSHLHINIKLQPTFTANFFIECNQSFAERLGMLPFLFAIVDVNNAPGHIVPAPEPNEISMFDYITPIQANGYVAYTQEVQDALIANAVPNNSFDFTSDFTIRELDDRLSLDIVCVFPISRKIFVLDDKEEHEFLLARFDLTSYKTFENVSTQNDSNMLETINIVETFQAGLENMTRGNADFSSNMLLPGQIHQIHFMLYTRYRNKNVIERVKTDMEDGFWHLRLLFSKKV